MPKPRSSVVGREIQAVRQSLLSIAKALERLAPLLEAANAPGPGGSGRRGRKLTLSSKRRADLKRQGQYMGHLRGLKPRQKTQVKALKAAKGFPAAIALAKKLAAR